MQEFKTQMALTMEEFRQINDLREHYSEKYQELIKSRIDTITAQLSEEKQKQVERLKELYSAELNMLKEALVRETAHTKTQETVIHKLVRLVNKQEVQLMDKGILSRYLEFEEVQGEQQPYNFLDLENLKAEMKLQGEAQNR